MRFPITYVLRSRPMARSGTDSSPMATLRGRQLGCRANLLTWSHVRVRNLPGWRRCLRPRQPAHAGLWNSALRLPGRRCSRALGDASTYSDSPGEHPSLCWARVHAGGAPTHLGKAASRSTGQTTSTSGKHARSRDSSRYAGRVTPCCLCRRSSCMPCRSTSQQGNCPYPRTMEEPISKFRLVPFRAPWD